MKKKNRNARFGRYPSCDLCNNALRFILKGDPDGAFKEIVRAIQEADGYFHDDIAEIVQTADEVNMTEMKVTGAIFDFSQYEYMIVESDDGEVIAEIRQDSIDVEDGYRIRMCPRGKEA